MKRTWCCVVFDNDTKALGGGGDDGVEIWNLPTYQRIERLREKYKEVTCCTVLDNEQKVFVWFLYMARYGFGISVPNIWLES